MQETELRLQLKQAIEEDDFASAELYFAQLKKQGFTQEDVAFCYMMGTWYRQLDMLKKAELTLQQGLLLNQNEGLLHFELAVVYDVAGNLKAAREHYERALILIPEFIDGRYCLAKLEQQEGNNDRAAKLFCEIIDLIPVDLNMYIRLAVELSEMGLKDEAIQLYYIVLLAEPDNGSLYSNLGVEFAELGEFASAEFCHKYALALEEDNGDLWYNAACTYTLMNEPMLAFYALEKAISLEEENKFFAANDGELVGLHHYDRFWQLVGEERN